LKTVSNLGSISAIDLFCGVGGMTHGLIKAGIPVTAGIDSDHTCRYAYEKNNRARFINADIRNFSSTEVENLFNEAAVRIMVGCAPCQPFSNHTQKDKGRKSDEKWGLLYSFGRLIEDITPEIVSMENVPQITRHEVFDDFLSILDSLKYKVSYKHVYCPDYGVPQTRTRLVLLASRLGRIELIPKTHVRSRYRDVKSVIGNLQPIGDGSIAKDDPMHRAQRLSKLNKSRILQSKPGGTWGDWDPSLVPNCLTKASGKTYVSVYGRMEWDKLAPTITTQFFTYGTGRFGHPEQNRALSLREGALLQTFPKSYKFYGSEGPKSFSRIGTHIGNAVPVRLGLVIGRSIKKHLDNYYENLE